MQFNNRHHDLLQAIPEGCESYDMHALDELMPEPLPTPPLSPEHTSSSSVSSPSSSQYSYEMDVLEFGEALLNDLFENEQISCDGESLSGDNQDICTNFLIQDCMWNCSSYEPRNGNGVYTPAPSPPPPKEQTEKTEDKVPHSAPVKEATTVQADCISPVDVFPSCHLFMPQEELSQDLKVAKMKPKKLVDKKTAKENHKAAFTRRSMSVSSCRPRFQPQATSSESGEFKEQLYVM